MILAAWAVKLHDVKLKIAIKEIERTNFFWSLVTKSGAQFELCHVLLKIQEGIRDLCIREVMH